MSVVASLIIPTHNRSASLKKMLENLEHQSCPLQNFEVIIVANGCTDNTVEMIKTYKAGFQLRLYESPAGSGPAPARNLGASVANGKWLIFADDDMEPSIDFIKEHIKKHERENNVVIGYAPMKLESRAGIQRKIIREWWEEKFQKLRKKGHRFTYEDLTSGNFSISSQLYKQVNGFNTAFPTRDDYELGFRLIEAGAQFCFAYEARTFHNDQVTDLHRSLQRKKVEASADIEFQKLHPELKNQEGVLYVNLHSFSNAFLLRVIRLFPSLTDALARWAFNCMGYLEKINMIPLWLKMNYRLHQYWYLRGLAGTFPSVKELYHFINDIPAPPKANWKITIDLQQGLKKIEEELDRIKPGEMDIYYGTKLIGTVEYEPGAEPIKGIHLRQMLKDKFYKELLSVIDPDISIK